MFGVPWGSILGPLLCNIFFANLYFILNDVDITNFSDDNTPYTTAKNTDDVINSLEKTSNTFFQWFKDKDFWAILNKYNLVASASQKTKVNIR